MSFLVIVFCAVMVATRYPFSPDLHSFDASWALFFILGLIQLRPKPLMGSFVFLVLLGWGIDILAIDGGVVGGYCMTPAYAGMPLTYLVLTLCGVAARRIELPSVRGYLRIFWVMLFAGITAFALSNSFFYLGSGYFPKMSALEYASKVIGYLPEYLIIMGLYCSAWLALDQFFLLQHRFFSVTKKVAL